MSDKTFTSLKQYEEAAKEKLDDLTNSYFYKGPNSSAGLKRNEEALQKVFLCPNICVDVSKRSTQITLLGKELSMPVGIGPCALHSLTNKDGELATARAAEYSKVLYVVSQYSTQPLRDIRKTAPNTLIFMQINMLSEEFITRSYIEGIEREGVNGFVLTLDHNSFSPDRPTLNEEFRSTVYLPNMPEGFCDYAKAANSVNKWTNDSYTWESVKRIMTYTTLPIIVKGILSPKNAREAIKTGVAGIWVSNHGGRNSSDYPATIDAFRSIAPIVKASGILLFADGGIRTGGDILKFLALGAKMVFIAKPVISALVVNGSEGLNSVFSLLKSDLETNMAMCGYNSIDEVDQNCLWDNRSNI
ncbi:DgyrCDS7484 [Dimorphilus gyrociliatus]|uniref:DgyrCDS7484 n=1 Tax=Dimorphilus gyrociliatus TaxID=2664684 RepID=A0A7I8VS49_9ANNE|nr:DgyrCDS7484 [Dimorphilus gyrociliatus]